MPRSAKCEKYKKIMIVFKIWACAAQPGPAPNYKKQFQILCFMLNLQVNFRVIRKLIVYISDLCIAN